MGITYLSDVMAEVYHEKGVRMQPVEKNLKYSAKRLTHLRSDLGAQLYANNPQKLANKAYGGSMGSVAR